MILILVAMSCEQAVESPIENFVDIESSMRRWAKAEPLKLSMSMVQMAPTGISETKVIIEASHWLGVRYVLGGESKSGVDCSGLVRQVYMNASGKRAYYRDRTAHNIMLNSDPVWPPKPGDVMIFVEKGSNPKHCSHVGLFEKPSSNGYGDCYFIHAGKKPGKVVRDRLYYSPHYGNGWWYNNFDIYSGRYDADHWNL